MAGVSCCIVGMLFKPRLVQRGADLGYEQAAPLCMEFAGLISFDVVSYPYGVGRALIR
jgi:hypothetical protein